MNGMLNLDKIPDQAYTKPEAGPRNFTIKSCEIVKATTSGSLMFQLSHVSDAGEKVNYDNCPFMDKEGNPMNFGLVKIKKYLKATNNEIKGDFDPKIVPALLIGKRFNAIAEPDEKGYLHINNIDSILPALEEGQDVTPEMFENDQNLQAVNVDIDDEWK